MPEINSSRSHEPESAEIIAALTEMSSALQDLVNRREQALDPTAMMMWMMIARRNALAVPSDAELVQRSHDLIDAFDRGDVDAVDEALAPGFVHFEGGPAHDRDAILACVRQRTSTAPRIARRSWADERVVRKDDALVFMGRAHEVQGGNDTHGGYLYDGWYLLQWVRAGDRWRVQLWTWQKEATAREWWNDTFRIGRGFSREPNRLLAETIANEIPGDVLDLAMGQGRNALDLASRGWKVTGVDCSDEGLRLAREQALARGFALDAIHADLDDWDFGTNRFDLVTWIYAGDQAHWLDKVKASLRARGLFVLEAWAKETPDHPIGFGEGQLAASFEGYEILRDEIVEDVPDWARDSGRLVRFVARKVG